MAEVLGMGASGAVRGFDAVERVMWGNVLALNDARSSSEVEPFGVAVPFGAVVPFGTAGAGSRIFAITGSCSHVLDISKI